MTLSKDVENLAEWIETKMQSEKYGEIQVTLKIHDGRPTLLEKAFLEKIQLTGYTRGKNEDQRHR